MNLTETYYRLALDEFWNQLDTDYMSEEDIDTDLETLLKASNQLIFEKFGINRSDKVYFICGSSRLYLYPKLREAFNLSGSIGDLDIVIPDRKLWDKANIKKNIYKPSKDYNIEVFDTWDPSRADGPYADISVRSDSEILRDSSMIRGYYFMSLKDIMDYKMKMSREKEMDVVNLFQQYLKSSVKDRIGFLRKMSKIIGFDNTKQFIQQGKIT